jgi:putative transposase
VGREGSCGGAKKLKGRKRHLLVDTQGLVLKAKVHPANAMDRDGIEQLLERARDPSRYLSRLWLDAGYSRGGKGKDRAEKVLGLTVAVVRRPPKPRYLWVPEGQEPDWETLRTGDSYRPWASRSCRSDVSH